MKRGRRAESEKSEEFRINEKITGDTVRIVGDGEARIVPLSEALNEAKEKDLDLVEISPNQNPPIVKITDYSKFKFEQLKKAKDAKKKQKIIHVKEIKMRPAINDHDFEHKINHAKEFLDDGDKVKFTLMFRGREMVHPDLGFSLMGRVKAMLADTILVEKEPSQEGRNITMNVAPKSAAKAGKKQDRENENP